MKSIRCLHGRVFVAALISAFVATATLASTQMSVFYGKTGLPWQITNSTSDLDFVLNHITEVCFHRSKVDKLANDNSSAFENVIGLINALNMIFSVEANDLRYDDSNPNLSGEKSWDVTKASLAKAVALGGSIDRIYIDGGIAKFLYYPIESGQYAQATGFNWHSARRELIDYMCQIEKDYPNAEVYLVINSPNYGWKDGRAIYKRVASDNMGLGDMYDYLNYIRSATRSFPLDGVIVDQPYEGAMGWANTNTNSMYYNGDNSTIDWMARLVDMEDTIKNEFGLNAAQFFNAAHSDGAAQSNHSYYFRTLDFVKQFRAKGGSPDHYAMHSWFSYPTRFEPEVSVIDSDGFGDYTIAGLCMATIEEAMRSEIDGHLWGFNSEGDHQNWKRVGTTGQTTNGFLKGTSSSSDPYFYNNSVSIDGSAHNTVEIALAVNGGSTAQVYFKVQGNNAWKGPKNVSINSDGSMRVYNVDMSGVSGWSGNTISHLRIDPTNTSNADIALDYIRVKP